MDAQSGRALVVDDEHGVRELCRAVLVQMGYAVECCASGAEALALFASAARFDLMLIDVHMPEMDGVELLRRTRHLDRSMAVIVMTGYGSLENTAQVTLLGAQAILLKPFSLAELRSIAREVLHKRRAERAEAQFAALQPLAALSEKLLGIPDLPRLHAQIVQTARAMLQADRVLLLRSNDHLSLQVVAEEGSLPVAQAEWLEIGALATSRRLPIVVPAPNEQPCELIEAHDHPCMVLCVPLIAHSEVFGALQVERCAPSPPFLPAQIELTMVLSSIAASALESAELHTTLARSEARYRALLEHARDAVLLLSRDGSCVLEANAAAELLSGYTRLQLQTLDPRTLIRTEPPPAPDLFSLTEEFDTLLQTREGREVPISIVISVIAHEATELLLVVVRDISERTRLSQQLVRAEKLAAMGRLTASIAHEVNNPLQALQSSLSLLVERHISDEKRTQITQMAHNQVEELVGIVQHMMDLYRPTREGVRPVSAHELLESVLTTLEPRLRQDHIQIERDWDGYLPRISGTLSQLRQVFSSVILNAVDAMPDGGKLTLRTQRSRRDDTQVVLIEIADNGPGIAPEEMGSIFEPFYSKRGQRTGLSLAVSYSIIEQHGGRLTVTSSNHGATFQIALPAYPSGGNT